MNKEEVIKNIEGKIDAGYATIEIAYIVSSKYWMESMAKDVQPVRLHIKTPDSEDIIDFSNPAKIVEKYLNPEAVHNDCLNIIKLGLVNMISQTFELIKNYSKATGQYELFKKQYWWTFAGIIRNAFNHNFVLMGINDNDKSNYVQFSKRRIEFDESMNGQEISFRVLPIRYCFELAEIMLESFISQFK